jgi:BirA family biotin operon repressor/biotin-[acetyl-CoA-carboxylase] ligase
MNAGSPLLPFTQETVSAALSAGAFGRPLHFHSLVDSTNSRAVELARAGAPEGTVVLADAQSAGRGRSDRRWESPPGMGIYLSVVLRPPLDAERATFLTSVAALSATAVAGETASVQAEIKWPNDVLAGGRKVAGILAERGGSGATTWVVAGFGVNLNHRRDDFPAALAAKATSLRAEGGAIYCRVRFVALLLERFESDYRAFLEVGPAALLERIRERSAVLGHRIEIHDGARRVQGIALGLDESGGLILGKGKGRETFHQGSIVRIW